MHTSSNDRAAIDTANKTADTENKPLLTPVRLQNLLQATHNTGEDTYTGIKVYGAISQYFDIQVSNWPNS